MDTHTPRLRNHHSACCATSTAPASHPPCVTGSSEKIGIRKQRAVREGRARTRARLRRRAGCPHGVADAAQRRCTPHVRGGRFVGVGQGRLRGASRLPPAAARSHRRVSHAPAHPLRGARFVAPGGRAPAWKLRSPKTQGVCFASPQDTALFVDTARGRYLRSSDGDLVRARRIARCLGRRPGRSPLMRAAPSAVALCLSQRRRDRGAAAAEGAAGRGRRGCRAGAFSRPAAAAAALAVSRRSPLISTPRLWLLCR